MLLRNSNKTSSFFCCCYFMLWCVFYTYLLAQKFFSKLLYIALYTTYGYNKTFNIFLCICVSTIKLHDYWLLVVFTLAQCTNFFRYFFCVSYFFRYSISKHLNISIYHLFFCASDIDIFTLCVHIYRNEYSNSFTLVIRNL